MEQGESPPQKSLRPCLLGAHSAKSLRVNEENAIFFLKRSCESEHFNNKQTVLRELHRRIYCTQENTVKKTKEVAVQSIDLDNKTAGANICVISINSLVLPCLRGFRSSTKSLKRKQEFIESVDQMKKICGQLQ